MYRILLVNWIDIANPEAGGAEVHLHEISKRLVTRGHKVTILASTFRDCLSEEEIDGIRIMRRGGRFFFNFHVPRALKSLTDRDEFDIVVDDINKIPFYTPLYVKKPILALAHHLFARTIFIETVLPLAAYVYLSELLIPAVYRNTRFVVVSESTREDFVRRGLPESNIEVVYNAVDHGRYTPSFEDKAKEPMVAYIGRIKKYKSIDHLLKAAKIVFERIPRAHLVVAGAGDYLDSLVATARRLGIADRVDFRGFVSEEEKVSILQKAHVVVNPSSKEGWGVTVIEANACGTPVVASDVPGLRDAVRDKETGLLVSYGDIDGFAESISDVLTDESLRERLSQEAVRWARRFNWDDSADAILKVIAEVVMEHQTSKSR
jgi:glycosyltransferase involved in cell wall biosynthesis